MSKTRSVAAAVGAMLALACGQMTSEPIETGSDGPAPVFGATQFMTRFTIPVDELFAAPCANGGAGENIRITGSNAISIQETITPSNNRILRIHLQPEISGVGETSGDRYRASRSPGQIMEIERGDGLPFLINFLPQPIVLIGEDAAGTILIYTRFQLVINNNDVTTVVKENFSARCQGPGQ
ncbi:MAG: hypothetical protein ACRDHY_09855 [Anaerolineales bacterium]